MKRFQYYVLFSILLLIATALIAVVRCDVILSKASESSLNQEAKILSVNELKNIASRITVKISMPEGVGSGTLVKRSANVYMVLTNHHVIENASNIKVQTFDGKVHLASLVNIDFQGNDLALLQFESEANYQVAKLAGLAKISVKETVFAGGYPYDATVPTELVFNQGELFDVIRKPLIEGYQLGYSNEIDKGMSGGPLLNQRGEVIGIHGINAYPIWGDPFIFADGGKPSERERDVMIRYSWGIPVQTVTNFAKDYLSLVIYDKKKVVIGDRNDFFVLLLNTFEVYREKYL